MSSPLPQWHSFTKFSQGRTSFRQNGFFHSLNSTTGMGIFCGSFFLVGLIFCTALLSPHGPLSLSSSEPYGLSRLSSNESTPTIHAPSLHTPDEAPSSLSDVLSLEQVRDIVATTRGFFSRDYSLNLGWNNVSIRKSLIRAELIIPE